MKHPADDHTNALEWIVFGIGLTAIVALLALFTYRTFTNESSAAEITIQYTHTPTEHSPFRYHISVENTGGKTAENVVIELVLQKGNEVMERAQMEIPYVPKSSKREGWMSFTIDPASADTISARP